MLRMKIAISVLCLLLVNLATSQVNNQLDKFIQNASLIVEAKVIDRTVFERQGNIFTSYEMEIYKQFKGDNQSKSIRIVRVGGSFENEGLMVFPSTELNEQETGIFLLKSITNSENRSYRFTSASNSFLPVDYIENIVHGSVLEKGSANLDVLYKTMKRKIGHDFIEMKQIPKEISIVARNMKINSIDQLDVCAGCGAVIKISGEGFLANRGDFGAVLFANANMSSSANTISAVKYISWSDTEIELIVPSNAGSGAVVVRNKFFQKSPKSEDHIHIEYNIMNTPRGYEIRLIDDESDGDLGYKFQFSDEIANNGVDFTSIPNATNIVYEAFSHFNTHVPNFAIYLDDACPTVLNQKPSNDNVNLISFDNDLWDLDMMVGDNSYGAIYMRWIKCGDSEPEVVDIDMIIRRDGDPNSMLGAVKWNFGDTLAGADAMDFSSVIMHQLGHAMLLGHVKDADMLMHYNLGQGESKRHLTPNDSIAAGWVHAQSKAYNPPMVNCLYQFSQVRNYGDYDSTQVCDISVLAIESIDLKVKKLNNETTILDFEVIGERDFGSYDIYKKTNYEAYRLIDKIQAHNDRTDALYNYEDYDVNTGMSTYRIQVKNSQGALILSNEVSVNSELNEQLVIVQNPIVDQLLRLRIPLMLKGKLFKIFDMNGKLRLEDVLQETISLDQLEQGTYFIRTKDSGTDEIVKFVKM